MAPVELIISSGIMTALMLLILVQLSRVRKELLSWRKEWRENLPSSEKFLEVERPRAKPESVR